MLTIDDAGIFSKWRTQKRQESPIEAQVQLCIDWIQTYGIRTKTVRKKRGSYGWKHVIERKTGLYVSNGAFLEAANRLGFTIKPLGTGPNALLNITVDRKYEDPTRTDWMNPQVYPTLPPPNPIIIYRK